MSERAPHFEDQDFDPAAYGERKPAHETDQAANKEAAPAPSESIDHILEKIEREAKHSHEVIAEQDRYDNQHHIAHRGVADAHTASHTRVHTLKQVQRQLKGPNRTFSKVIHNPTVDAVSTFSAETVARPSGLLLGGICSLIGSIGVVVVCRFYGYEYNYLIGLACFVGGFLFGLLFELIFRLFRKLV